MTKDLTSGSPLKLIISFTVPIVFGLMFQQLYSFVDAAIVGKILGINSLAAVGATGSLNFLIIGMCIGLCSGFSIPIAQAFGARDFTNLRKRFANSIWLSIVLFVGMTIFTVAYCLPMLKAMKTPGNIIDESFAYMVVIFAFIPCTAFYNLLSSILRAIGNSRTPVFALIMGSLINIVLDILFIGKFKMGVAGAAYATGISQFCAGLYCLVSLKRTNDKTLKFQKDDLKINFIIIRILFNQGFPMGLQFSITAIGAVILTVAVNMLGSNAVASMTAGIKISMFFCCVFDALGTTAAVYAGQNLGARDINRIKQGVNVCFSIGAVLCVTNFLIIYFFGQNMLTLFIDPSETVVLANAYKLNVINAMFYGALLIIMVLRPAIQGMGYAFIAIFAGVFEMLARILIAVIFIPKFGFTAACFANPAAWVFADVFLLFVYRYVLKRTSKLFAIKTKESIYAN